MKYDEGDILNRKLVVHLKCEVEVIDYADERLSDVITSALKQYINTDEFKDGIGPYPKEQMYRESTPENRWVNIKVSEDIENIYT